MRAARDLATRLVAEVRSAAPTLLAADGIDLSSAMEQHCYLWLVDPHPARRAKARVFSSPTLAALGRAVGKNQPRTQADLRGHGALLVQAAVHCRIWQPVAEACAQQGMSPITVVAAARFHGGGGCEPDAQLSKYLDRRRASLLGRSALERALRWTDATRGWDSLLEAEQSTALRSRSRTALARLTSLALQLAVLIDELRPPLLITFAELSESSRIFGNAGKARGIPTLDLPHAEAVDPGRLRGLTYDRIAVFGPVAADVMRAAGVPTGRITEIGAPHFDRLSSMQHLVPALPRRVVFASQYLGGRMTAEVKAATAKAAIAAAAALAPATLVIRRHPLESDDVVERELAQALPQGLSVTMASDEPVERTLAGAWLLTTAWSNTVYEAALLGIPSLTINTTGGPDPMPFAHEGISVGATDPSSASAAARRLRDHAARHDAVSRIQGPLTAHLGPLDGHASERAAALISDLLRSGASRRR